MHASIWKLAGDPDDLLRGYDAMTAEIPSASLQCQLCLRAPDGILIIDTCASREAFEALIASEDFDALRQRHQLPDPTQLDDYPVHTLIINGASATDPTR